ncbi:MAG TPA: MFS transporter [Paenalcaligenes sp.]|nr:MFS transporter [Paenalcaligenes sp.]
MTQLSLTGEVRRNTLLLSGLQALGGANPAVVVALGGLVGEALSHNEKIATLPVSLFNMGMAIGILPAAWIMRKLGRRGGYFIGSLLGIIGGLTAFTGIAKASFLIFCIGTVIAGFYSSYVQSYRFAAADSVSAALRPRAISWVMIGGLAAALIATQVILHTAEIVPGLPFAGTFFAQATLAALALPLIWLLRTDSLHVQPQHKEYSGRPLGVILRNPRLIISIIAGMVAYSLMSFMMTATPLAMVHHGHTMRESTLGIQWHILAMFGPSFFTGHLIRRFGKITITITGMILFAGASISALSGLSVAHFWTSLILLGLGWNFGFIGATTLVTDCYHPQERNKVQAVNDFFVFGSVALSSFSSGRLLALHGWDGINIWSLPVIAVTILLLLILGLYERNNQNHIIAAEGS